MGGCVCQYVCVCDGEGGMQERETTGRVIERVLRGGGKPHVCVCLQVMMCVDDQSLRSK